MTRRQLLFSLSGAGGLLADTNGTLRLRARTRKFGLPVEQDVDWKATETAIIICDMWNGHYCKNSVTRIDEIVPRMNETLNAARKAGVQIIHAPSGTMAVYEGMPQRKRMQEVAAVTPPTPIAKWCYLDLKDEAPLPIDDAKSPCDDAVVGEAVRRFDRQHPGLEIGAPDGISDNGTEIYSYFVHKGIKNAAMMGVHTNMCVLGRPFGIRQLKRLGMNVVLVRDLTDAMYDPREAPFVSHWRGTELVIEHVEQYWCPTVLGAHLMQTGTRKSA